MTIITILFKSFFNIFLAIGAVATLIFALGCYLIVIMSRDKQAARMSAVSGMKKSEAKEKVVHDEAVKDVSAIAGDDPVATQLDLAKAYIESGKSQLARIILTAVIKHGSNNDQEEAQRLLSTI
jgi:FimV-like protein